MKLKKELLLLGCALVACLLVAEGVLRLYYGLTYESSLDDLRGAASSPAPGSVVYLGEVLQVSPEPKVVYEMQPNLDVRFRGAQLRTNSQGWRDGKLAPGKAPGTLRLLGIGDSVMFGWGVEEHQRYLDRLQHRLTKAYPERRWQTVNMAVPGYNLVMEVEALKRSGLAYSPDLIVVGFSVNDFCLPNFVLPRRSVWSSESFIKLFLTRGQQLMPQLVERFDVLRNADKIEKRPEGAAFFETYCSQDNVPPEVESLVGPSHFMAALVDLVEIGRQREIPVVFLHHGIGQGYVALGDIAPKAPPEITAALAAVRDLEGLIVADLTDELRIRNQVGQGAPPLVLSPTDPHPSAQGHSLIARLLTERLVRSGVIDTLVARSAP